MANKSLMCQLGYYKYKLMLRLNEGMLAKHRKARLKKTFTIISNNCWGAYIYRLFKEPYRSPTIGLFIMPDDFLKMIRKLDYYMKDCRLKFIKPEKSRHYDELKTHKHFGEYPVGVLGDVEIFFVHYKDEKEAREKWTRRAERINWDNLIIKFNDQNGCTEEQIMDFNRINKFKKMICFTAKRIPGKYNVHMWEFERDGFVYDDKYFVFQHVNLKKLIEE